MATSVDKQWLERQYNKDGSIMMPKDLEKMMKDPPRDIRIDEKTFDRIYGSMIGMALGDALGAFVEFRPHAYMVDNPVTTLTGGGTWGLKEGQFTDDTSMGLCLANSLVAQRNYVPYDQLVRYKWWYKEGYMSSTGKCFDIGAATKQSLREFERRQHEFANENNISLDQIDTLSDPTLLDKFDVNCSKDGVAGNGALMRLAPVPLFFHRDPIFAIKCSGHSGEITHGDEKAYDACRYYGALIVAAVRGESREELLNDSFYEKHKEWFGDKELHPEIMDIAKGSYKKRGGYEEGIRGKGYIADALEAALWAFWREEKSFEEGVLAAVNLGDDTDTTAAIYGQLAGAYYGYKTLRKDWVKKIYAKDYIECLSKWIVYEGEKWFRQCKNALNIPIEEPNSTRQRSRTVVDPPVPIQVATVSPESNDPKSKFKPRRNSTHELFPSSYLKQPRTNELCRANSSKQESSKDLYSRIYIHKKVNSADDVCRWLISYKSDLKAYTKIFKDYNIDGYWFLNHLRDEYLREKGVENANHRLDIMKAIDKLKSECPVTYAQKNA